jgi:hypothetical protein
MSTVAASCQKASLDAVDPLEMPPARALAGNAAVAGRRAALGTRLRRGATRTPSRVVIRTFSAFAAEFAAAPRTSSRGPTKESAAVADC